jgi:hypothetical protein
MTARYFRWLSDATNKALAFRIFSAKWWWDELPEMWLAQLCAISLPFLIIYDLLEWAITCSRAAAEALDAQWRIDHADDLRMAEAEKARQAYLADLRIADLIDDLDTREMAITHANNKYHRRLAEIMGE